MSDGKSILVDTTRCTGCRGCQVACKQWNNLPGTETKQTGSYQNPPDSSFETYKVVRFAEGRNAEGKPYWHFFSDMCRHCTNPPCLAGGDEIVHDEATGAVVYPKGNSQIDFDTALGVCPYNIPRKSEKSAEVSKCTMCLDRIQGGRKPACVLSCPTAMEFGERDEILKEVERRVAELQKSNPKAQAIDVDDVRVIFIVDDDPATYHEHAAAQ